MAFKEAFPCRPWGTQRLPIKRIWLVALQRVRIISKTTFPKLCSESKTGFQNRRMNPKLCSESQTTTEIQNCDRSPKPAPQSKTMTWIQNCTRNPKLIPGIPNYPGNPKLPPKSKTANKIKNSHWNPKLHLKSQTAASFKNWTHPRIQNSPERLQLPMGHKNWQGRLVQAHRR